MPTSHRPRPSLARDCAKAVVTACALSAVLGVVMVGEAGRAEPSGSAPAPLTVTQPTAPETRLMRRFDCSVTGYGDGSTPQSAIVRAPLHRPRVVSFNEGWRVHVADGATELVAVCLRPPR
jgi:hypothetical protein